MSRKIILLIYLFFGSVTALLMPVTVIWDSYLYLTSGMSLFSSEFPSWYLLMREPGYPFLIWLLIDFLNLGLWSLVFVQGLMLGLGAYFVSTVFISHFKISRRIETLLGIAGLTLVRGYGSTVMQQASVFLVLSICLWLVSEKKHFEQKKYFWKFLFLGFFAASMAVQLFLIVIGAIVLRLVLSLKFVSLNWSTLPSVIIGGALILVPWYSYTSSVDLSKQIYPSCRNAFCLNGFSADATFLDKAEQVISSGSALLFLSRETYATVGPDPRVAQEAITYGNPWFDTSQNRCVRLGPGPEKEVLKTKDLVTYHCNSKYTMKIQGLLSIFMTPLFPLSGMFFLFWIGRWLQTPRKESNYILIVPFTVIAFYAMAGGGISRYNSIIPMMGPFFIYLWFSKKKSNSSF
jgi:hypothetical protein